MNDIEPGDLVLETRHKRVFFVTSRYTLEDIPCLEGVVAEDETAADNWLRPLLFRCDEVQKIVCVDDL